MARSRLGTRHLKLYLQYSLSCQWCSLIGSRTPSIPGAAPRSRVVGTAATARTLDQRFLNLRVLWCAGMQAVVVRQNISPIVAGPIGVHRRAPLPAEFQAIVGRLGGVVDVRRPSAGDIGVYRYGLAVEEDLIVEITRVENRGPGSVRRIRRVEARRRSRRGRRIEDQETIRKR